MKMPFGVIPELNAPRAVAKQESDFDSDDEGEVRFSILTNVCPFNSLLGFLAIQEIL